MGRFNDAAFIIWKFHSSSKNESQTTGSAGFFVPTVTLMTYDVSTLVEIMLLTCAIIPMGRLQALTYPKAQGIWCFETIKL